MIEREANIAKETPIVVSSEPIVVFQPLLIRIEPVRHLSLETREKLRQRALQRWADPEFREKMKDKMPRIPKGSHLSLETRIRMSEAHKGKAISPEQKRKQSEAMKGRKKSPDAIKRGIETRKAKKAARRAREIQIFPERKKDSDITRKRKSEASKKKWQDPEYREKVLKSKKNRPTPTPMKGKHHTAEARAKMSAARRGKKRSPESIAKTVESNKRRWQDPEWRRNHVGRKHTKQEREKISRANKGKKKSPEHIKKQAESMRRRWKDPAFRNRFLGRKLSPETRAKIATARIDRDIERSLWTYAKKNKLFPTMIDKNMMTPLEIETLRLFFEGQSGKSEPPFGLMEKLSTAVAKLA